MKAAQAKAGILIVEDDVRLSQQLTEMLIASGFDTSMATDGETGLSLALNNHFSLILLDVGLPDSDGFTILKTIRQQHTTPVLMLTAYGAEQERITGLQNGADDYLPKPFNFTELLLRIEAILKRVHFPENHNNFPLQLNHNGLVLDRQAQRVWFDGQSINLTRVQFKLLWTLVSESGQTLSKPMLYRIVLGRDFSRYDRSLDMHVSRIRRKLISAGMPSDCILTSHGSGYTMQ